MHKDTEQSQKRATFRKQALRIGAGLVAAMTMTHAMAIKVWDPTNFVQNKISALQAIKATADRAIQIRTQYMQYLIEAKQLTGMPKEEMNRLRALRSRDLDDINGFIRSIDRTYGSVQTVKDLMSKRFDEQKLSGLSWDDYMKAEGQRIKQGVQSAQQRAEIDRRAMARVQQDYEQVKEWQMKIGTTHGMHESMQLMNAQMNKVVTQNAELLKVMAMNSMRENENKVDKMAEKKKQADDAQRHIDAVNKANKQSEQDLARWKNKT